MTVATQPGSPDYVKAEGERLLEFARNARLPDWGYGWLGSTGSLMPDGVVHTYLTARMTHVFSLAGLLGHEWAADFADHGVAALSGPLHDSQYGGWHTATDRAGRPLADEKAAYPHTFVLLAAASATIADRPGAKELLSRARDVIDSRFREPTSGLLRERWDRSWSSLDSYRGGNSNMHAVEALLAASDATGEAEPADQALSIAAFLVDSVARNFEWRIVEHYDESWNPALLYNEHQVAHPFRPFGYTPGHGIEWARLLLHLHAARPDAEWLIPAAKYLFSRAQRDGWNADGHEGFLYTVDWEGKPVVTQRLHWVLAEAIGAASAMYRVTGEETYRLRYDQWWRWAEDHFVDRSDGSWSHELDATGRPASTLKEGKADVYHAFQATLVPRLPLTASLASAIRARSHVDRP